MGEKFGIMKKSSICYIIMLIFSLILSVSCPNKPQETDVDENAIKITTNSVFEISGLVGKEIDPIDITLNIDGGLFDAVEASDYEKSNVSSFFSSAVDGLDYRITESIRGLGYHVLKIRISGTPTSVVEKTTDLGITVKKEYIKGALKDYEVEDFKYSEEIGKEDDVVFPLAYVVATNGDDLLINNVVLLADKEIDPITVRVQITNATFVEDKLKESNIEDWISPSSRIDGLQYGNAALDESSGVLTFTISGTPKEVKNTTLHMVIPKDVLSVNFQDILPQGDSIGIFVEDAPRVKVATRSSLDGYINEVFSRSISFKLENAKLVGDAPSDPSSWFEYTDDEGDKVQSLPEDITASLQFENDSDIYVTLSGTPVAVSRNELKFTVPPEYYDYKNDELDKEFYEKSQLSANTNGISFNLKDKDGVSVVGTNQKIVALQNQKNTNTQYISLKSESSKFRSSIIGEDISSSFSSSGSGGFKYTASSLSDDSLTLRVSVEDNRNASELTRLQKDAISIVLPSTYFIDADEDKTVDTYGLSYYVVQAPSVTTDTTRSGYDFKGVLNSTVTSVHYYFNVSGFNLVVNPPAVSLGNMDVSSWFRNQNGDVYNLPGLTYTITYVNTVLPIGSFERLVSIGITIEGTPEDIPTDNQQIFIVIPKDSYVYTDRNLNGLERNDITISGFNPSYNIYDFGASLKDSITVKGKMNEGIFDDEGNVIQSGRDVTIRLRDVSFKSISRGTDVRSWFGENVEQAFNEGDIVVKSNVIPGSNEITITIKGVPTRSKSVPRLRENMDIKIPSKYLNSPLSGDFELNVNTNVSNVQSMWDIVDNSASLVIEGMQGPIAAIVNHPETLNNNEFKIRVIDNYFNVMDISPNNANIRDAIVGLPDYFDILVYWDDEDASYIDDIHLITSSLNIRISANTISSICTEDFSINFADELFWDQENIPVFDETSIPEDARKFAITAEPCISDFSVNGSIIGIVGMNVEMFTKSWMTVDGWTNDFVMNIGLENAYFSDDVLNSDVITSWLTNYVPVNGLSFKYSVSGSVALEDGMRHATRIEVYPTGTPQEAKRVFSSTDGTRTLGIRSESNSFITPLNKYAKPFNITLEADTTATLYQEPCLYDGIYTIGLSLSQQNSEVPSAGSAVQNIMILNSTDSDTTIHLRDSNDWDSKSPIKNGWIYNNYERFSTSLFDIAFTSSYIDFADGGKQKYFFGLQDNRTSSDTPYWYEKGELKLMIPRKDIIPPVFDFSEYLVGIDAVSLRIVAN